MKKYFVLLPCSILIFITAISQQGRATKNKGKLFIIGGGSRSVALMQEMMKTADLLPGDHIAILPMSSENPDTSYYYIQKDLRKVCNNTIAGLNFTKNNVQDKVWLDSLSNARLIFITGGDQNRFMEVVLNTPVHTALLNAYTSGATIAGTSAGAAVMSKEMITGQEYSGDSTKDGTFKKIGYGLVQVKEGLGLIKTAIIDQHFIVRSRYNRLLSMLATYPHLNCIGIDEGTAIIVTDGNVKVTGERQVIRLQLPEQTRARQIKGEVVSLHNIQMDILVEGDNFSL